MDHFILFILFCLWGVNELFYEEKADGRYTVEKKDISKVDNTYYIKLNQYKLKLPNKYYKRIVNSPADYKILYSYNTLFKKGEFSHLEKYGASYKGN
ncbi:hypothetical protein M2M59_07085 [Rummeliibacillus sp. G93]|uniref:hypothetical protein n=1 Tax=Rummeliibacillus sp. G93 TaxID=2939494 RepID=UPI00201C25F7|nr:hypothetical protein [Rummeliibacillus sp. G93]UQW98771.1 hypothetical protein M2M59_07085 [Rummeliibacillus sp. G93]